MPLFQKETNQPELEEGLLSQSNDDQEKITPSDTSTTSKKTIYNLKWQVFAMVVSIQANAFVMMSIVPYIAFMCIHLVPGLTEQNAGTYAGAISTVSSLGKVCSSYIWSVVADKYGRKAVLYWTYGLTFIFSISFGLSSNITMAFVTRFFLGAANNNVIVIKTLCSELAEGDREFEGKLMGFVLGSRGYIGLYAPLLSGYLSDPVKQFPNSWLSTTFHGFLTTYPYFLPNLGSAIFCMLGFTTVMFFIPETKPNENRITGPKPSMKSIWAKPATRDHLIALWLYTFIAFFGVEAIPLFFVATAGGLSLQENLIGIVLTVSGLIYFFFQYITYEKIRQTFGVYGAMRLGSVLSAPPIILLPIAILLNRGQQPNTLSVAAFLFIIFIQGVRRIFGSMFMSSISLAANRSVERNEISVMNGLSMLGQSATQSISPYACGLLISFSLSSGVFDPAAGIYFSFGIICLMGIGACLFVFIRLKEHHLPNSSP